MDLCIGYDSWQARNFLLYWSCLRQHSGEIKMGLIFHGIQKLCILLGKLVSKLYPLMILLIFGVVILRYFFGVGWIWLQEIILWMHALIFLLVAPYALEEDAHVRVDVFYRKWSKKIKRGLICLGLYCSYVLFHYSYSSLRLIT